MNAAEGRKAIAEEIYQGAVGDPARLAASYGVTVSDPVLARVALLGIFGQQGVAGQLSPEPVALRPDEAAATALYTNYDGQGARFGHTSVQAEATNPKLSVFASFDLDAKVTVVLLNQSPDQADAVVLGFQGMGQKGGWRAFELTSGGAIVAAGSGTVYDAVLSRTVQPRSALLIEYRPVGGILPIRPAPKPLTAVEKVEADAAAPMGCETTDLGFLSLALLGLVGFIRHRSPH